MIVSAYQPYFAPFLGFFQKVVRSDILVLLDAVQFPQRSTWLTRNRLKNDQGSLWIKIPVWKRGLGLQTINEVGICNRGNWKRKNLASIRTAYRNAPFLEEHWPFLEDLFTSDYKRLVDLNLTIIFYLMKTLEIQTRVVLQSELGIDEKEPRLSVELSRRLGASCFLAQAGAKKYLDRGLFEEAGVGLQFFNPGPAVYPQLWGPFIANLSALDPLLNCGPKFRKLIE